MDYIESTISGCLNGLKVVLDCANGASSALAPQLFKELGAEVITVSSTSDGVNINEQCGSTHPDVLALEVVKHEADLGFVFDGDCARLIKEQSCQQ